MEKQELGFTMRVKHTAARAAAYEKEKGIFRRIATLIVSFILLICSFAPVVRLDMTGQFSWARQLKVNISPFDIIESAFYTFAGEDASAHITAEMTAILEKIPADVALKISRGTELSSSDIHLLNKIFNESNMFKVSVIAATYKNVGNSLSAIFYALLALALMILPFIYLILSIIALIRKKDVSLNKLLILTFVFLLGLIFSMGIGREGSFMGGGVIAYLTFASIFSVICIALRCVKNKSDFSVKRFIKTAVMCVFSVAILGLSYGNVGAVQFDKTQTDYIKDSYIINFTSSVFRDVFNLDIVDLDISKPEEIKTAVESLIEGNSTADIKINNLTTILPNIFLNSDMDATHKIAVILMYFMPFLSLSVFGVMLAAFIMTFSALLKGAPSKKNMSPQALFTASAGLAGAIIVVMTIITLMFNESAKYVDFSFRMLISGIPIVMLCLGILAAITSCLFKDRKTSETAQDSEVKIAEIAAKNAELEKKLFELTQNKESAKAGDAPAQE